MWSAPSEPKDEGGHGHDCDPGENNLSKVSHPLVCSAEDCGDEDIAYECIARREDVCLGTFERVIPTDVKVHWMGGVVNDLARHFEEEGVVDKERLVEVGEEANGGEY
jgi:hypothetical protein